MIFRRTTAEQAAPLLDAIARRRPERTSRRSGLKPTAEALARYVGRYELDETFCFIVTARRERLFAELTGQGHFELFAEREVDAFATVAFQTTFNADTGGRIDRAVIHITHFDLVMVRMSSKPRQRTTINRVGGRG